MASFALQGWRDDRVSNTKGLKFEEEVANKLHTLGWSVRRGIKFGEILGQHPEEDPGDIDVLAWHEDGLIFLLECKRLQFAKTPSEIAKQLSKFRGVVDAKGRPDRLAKHLKRWAIAQQNPDAFTHFAGLSRARIEAGLVFSHTVPMQFAIDRMSEKLWNGTIAQLETLVEQSDK